MKIRKQVDSGLTEEERRWVAQQAQHLGMTFTPGARVIDKTTKEVGTVAWAEWTTTGNEERYHVKLSNGELVERRADDLTPSPIAEGVELSEFDNPKL